MLEAVAELVNSGQLSLDGEADLLHCGTTTPSGAGTAGTSELPARFSAPMSSSDVNDGATVSSIEPQPVLTGEEMVKRGLIPSFRPDGTVSQANGGSSDGGVGMSEERIAAAVAAAARGPIAHEAPEAVGAWAARRKVVLSFGSAEEAADEAVQLGRAINELARTVVWHGTKPYRPGEVPEPEPEPESEPESERRSDSAEDACGASDEEELEDVTSVAAAERARRVDALQAKQPESEPESEPEPEPEPEPSCAFVGRVLKELGMAEKYGKALLESASSVAESVQEAAQSGDRDALRQLLKARGVAKLGPREKLVAALCVELPAAGAAPAAAGAGAGGDSGAPARLGEINIS
jgi:hypothetical protein